MAKLTVAEFRTQIRDVLDLDASDLPDALLDQFLIQGMRYAQRWNQGLWPEYENTWTFTLTSGVDTYTLTDLASNDANGYLIGNVRDVRSDDRKSFVYLSRDDFDRQVSRDNTSSGSPSIWSPRGTSIRVFPTPDAAYEIDVFGWRKPVNWVSEGAGGVSDLPEEFDDAILAYALGMAYAQQDEGQTSVFWLNLADVHLVQLEDAVDQMPPVDLVMNGRPRYVWAVETPGRIPFTFEV